MVNRETITIKLTEAELCCLMQGMKHATTDLQSNVDFVGHKWRATKRARALAVLARRRELQHKLARALGEHEGD